MKNRPMGAESFHADGRTDRYDEAIRSFANTPKNKFGANHLILLSHTFRPCMAIFREKTQY